MLEREVKQIRETWKRKANCWSGDGFMNHEKNLEKGETKLRLRKAV